MSKPGYTYVNFVSPGHKEDGSGPNGRPPRMRHLYSRPCGHFDYPGHRVGEDIPATDEQMAELEACEHCIDRVERAKQRALAAAV